MVQTLKSIPDFKSVGIRQALTDARAFLTANDTEGADMGAELLLEFVLGFERGRLFAHPELLLREKEALRYAELLKRRAAGEPVAYLTGAKGFWNYDFVVSSDTLIPRPETELLVESALELFKDKNTPLNILDMGTGSGAIMLTLLKELPCARGLAVDVSEKALAVARNNANLLKVADRVHFLQSDWFENLPEQAGPEYDLIVSNPPYIKAQDILTLQREVRLFEPELALNGGADGLEHYRTIIEKAHLYLKPAGWLGFETGERQHKDIAAMLKAAKQYQNVRSLKDYAGHERILWAQKQ